MNLPFIYLMNRLPSTSHVRPDISSQIVLQAPHSRSRGPKSRCFALLGVKVVITSITDEDSDDVGKIIGSTLSGCDATSIIFLCLLVLDLPILLHKVATTTTFRAREILLPRL